MDELCKQPGLILPLAHHLQWVKHWNGATQFIINDQRLWFQVSNVDIKYHTPEVDWSTPETAFSLARTGVCTLEIPFSFR